MPRAVSSSAKPRRRARSRAAGPVVWSRLAWPEIAALPAQGMDAVILPCGATEQHGPHLGTGMDACLATLLGDAVSAATGVPVLPTLAYGCSLGHSHRWPGTLAPQPQTLIALVTDLGDWLFAAGFRRLFLLNTHVTNFAPLRCALEILRSRHDGFMVALLNSADASPRVHREFFADAADWHANAAETALMLSHAPELVRHGLVKNADDPDRTGGLVFAHPVNRTSKNGVTGFPSRATKAQGRRLMRWLVEDLAKLVTNGLHERSPLNFSYFPSSSGQSPSAAHAAG
ncbi:MAG TPA: creatininase family protein [Opitutaceae bacterium]|nr:creatininase family protein [Opitutaceae bacterium]